jgi:hypothetical protein
MIHTARKLGFVFCGLSLCGAVGANDANVGAATQPKVAEPAQPTVQTVSRDAQLEHDVAQRLTDEARFSISLRREPLAQMLNLVENATAVRFRCGTLPDAPISVNAQDAPLFATLEPLFQEMGFAMRRDGLNVFLFSNRSIGNDNAPDVPVSWTVWKGVGAPAAGWTNPRARASTPTGRVTADSLVNAAPLSLEWNAPRADATSANWVPASLRVDASSRPGIMVSAPEADNSPVWMRWPLNLREVPAGAQLSLQTPHEVTLFVNGAPLVSGRRGAVSINLDKVLKPGNNCLALHWARVPKKLETPLLRYEWFVAGKPDVQSPAQAGARIDNQNPQLSQPVLIQPENGPRPGDAGSSFADAPIKK